MLSKLVSKRCWPLFNCIFKVLDKTWVISPRYCVNRTCNVQKYYCFCIERCMSQYLWNVEYKFGFHVNNIAYGDIYGITRIASVRYIFYYFTSSFISTQKECCKKGDFRKIIFFFIKILFTFRKIGVHLTKTHICHTSHLSLNNVFQYFKFKFQMLHPIYLVIFIFFCSCFLLLIFRHVSRKQIHKIF